MRVSVQTNFSFFPVDADFRLHDFPLSALSLCLRASVARTDSTEETTIGILINHPQRFRQRRRFKARLVTMPFAVRAHPKNAPAPQPRHLPDASDGCLRVLAGTTERRTDEEKVDGAPSKSLPLANLVPEMQRRPAARPENLLQHLHVLRYFVFNKPHLKTLL